MRALGATPLHIIRLQDYPKNGYYALSESGKLWKVGTPMYRDEVTTITNVFERHKVFFNARIPDIYAQLVTLVQRCRRLQQLGKRAQARQLLDDELFRLFGVATDFSDDRPLSVLAGVIRHVLISGARLQQPLMAKNVVGFLIDEVGGQMSIAEGGNQTLLVLDAKLNYLARWIPEHVSLLEMRYFARLGLEDTARELEVAADVVRRELRFARASLTRACGL